jgi:hypothetical protein
VLRQAVLEKVLGVGAMRSCPYLVVKPSQVGVDADENPTSASSHRLWMLA